MAFFGWDSGNHMIGKEAQLGRSGREGCECGGKLGDAFLCNATGETVYPDGCLSCKEENCLGRKAILACNSCGHKCDA